MAKRSTKKKQTLPVLFNYTNRPYSAWSEAEKAAVKAAYHEVVDLKVEGSAPTDASIDDLQELISAQFSAIFQPASEEYEKSGIAPLACITGEPTLIFSLVNHLEGAGMRCLAPIWKTNEKGEQEFSLFRLYSSDSNWSGEEDEEGGSEEGGEDDENALQQALAKLSQMLSGEGGESLAQELLQSAFPNGTDEEGGKVFNLADYIDSEDDYEDEEEEDGEEEEEEKGESAKLAAEKPKKDKKDKKEGKEKKAKKEEKDKKKKKK